MESARILVPMTRPAEGMPYAQCPNTGCSAIAPMAMRESPARSACSSSAVWTPIATATSDATKESAVIPAWSMELAAPMPSVGWWVARPSAPVHRTSLATRSVSADPWKEAAQANPVGRTPSALRCLEAMSAPAWMAALEMPTRDVSAVDR